MLYWHTLKLSLQNAQRIPLPASPRFSISAETHSHRSHVLASPPPPPHVEKVLYQMQASTTFSVNIQSTVIISPVSENPFGHQETVACKWPVAAERLVLHSGGTSAEC